MYDALYATNAAFNVRLQMAAGHEVDADGLRWTIALRDGLRFHDGEPVRASDVVASIRRWGARVAYGQTLMGVTEELAALDDRRLRFRLRKPFPLLLNALAYSGQSPFVMPEPMSLTAAAARADTGD